MQDYLTQLMDYLLRQSWQIAVLVLLIAAVSWLLRNRSAHTRYLLWLIVLAKCLVPPFLAIPLPVLPHEQPGEPVSTAPLLIPAGTFERDYMTALEFSELYSHPVQSGPAPSTIQEPSKPALRPTLTARQRLGLVWIAGVIVFTLAASTKALRTILWLRRKRKPLPDKLQADIEKLFEGKGFGTFPKVWLIRGIGQPFVWGLMRGSIYLPAHFVRLDNAGHRRDVLGHELSHVLRRDAAVNVLQIGAQAIFWFHPFVWWANKKIRAEREKCCDEMAISRLGAQAKSYSAAILNTLIADCRSTRPVPSLAIAGPVKNIEERIKTIMKPGKRFYKNPSLVGGFAVLLVALLTVPTALVLTARAEKANPATEQLAENSADVSELADSDQNSAAGADKPAIPEANLQIPDDLKPCAERLRTIYDALKRYEKDKGSLPDWLSELVPDYLRAELLIWPEDGPRSTPLAAEPHLPCSFGYQYSSSLSLPEGQMSYREFKDQERKVWGDVVPLVRYYIGKQCLNVSFDGRIYMSTTTWEREIQPQPGAPELLILKEVSVPASSGTAQVQPGTRPWGPEQATGAPDTHPAGDSPTAWAPLEPDAGREWLRVGFQRAVNIAEVRVRESFNPGAIIQVLAVSEDDQLHVVLWHGQDPTTEAPADFVLKPDADIVSKSVEIHLDTRDKGGFNEIDAVQLVGKDGSRQWASHATASSTYATQVTGHGTVAAGASRAAAPPATATRGATAKGQALAFDDFGGKFSLDWDIVHRDPSHYSLTKNPGTLTITTQNGHFKEASADYKNLFLIDTPVPQGEDFQITTCLSGFRPLQAYNQAGLICWDDEDNYLQWIFQKMRRRGLRFAAGVEAAGPTRYTYVPAGGPFDRLWLRVTKRGSSYECASSTDGTSFTVHTVEQWGDGSPKQIGLFAINGSLTNPPEVDASFEFFEVNSVGAQATPTIGPKYRIISPDHRQTPLAGAGTPKFTIPEANLQIPDDMRDCAEKLRIIHAALVKYQEDKGGMPHWLSDLVPNYLGAETLFCPDDPSHRTRFWPDPKLPCSYCYELNPTELHRRPPFDKTMCHYKTLQRRLFGDVVPIVRCFHHERALNLSWDGQIYTSATVFERLFIPNYNHGMLFKERPAKPRAPDEVTYESDLEAFFQEMDRTHPFFELKGIRDDWESTKKRLREEVKNCESDEKFLEIVTDAVMCLRDSHMWFRSTRVPPPQRPPRYCPGICFWPATNQRVIIAHSREELDPDLKAGTIVTRIDGRDARQYLEEHAKARWAEGGISGPQRARLFAYRMALRGEEKGEKHTITILADGKERDIELTSDVEARGWAHFYNLPKDMTQVGRSCWYRMLPSGAGYIYLRRVDNSTGPGLKEAFAKYPDAKGWIIDLRGNGGGGYDHALHEALQQLPRPLAVLIDAGCTSAGETLARDFVRHGDARLFGSKTAGSSSAKRTWTFPSGIASLSVPTRSRWGIDGNPIEFLGIEPHVKVEAVPEEVQRGLNSGILRAQEYLAEAISAQANKSRSE